MKKYIFIAFLSFITLIGVSQTKNDTIVSNIKQTILESLPDSSALTFKEVYSDIKSGLTALSSSLKVGSEHVYEVLIKQQLVNSITYLILFIILLFFSIFSFKIHYYFMKKNNEDFGDSPRCLIPIFSTLLLTVSILFFTSDTVTGFVNPEYGAIKEILEIIK